MDTILEPGDIVMTRSDSLVGRAIRFATRSFGERRSRVNHVGIIVVGGAIDDAIVVEALSHVVRRPLMSYAGKRTRVAIARPLNLPADDLRRIVDRAEGYVGRDYGWFKIVTHGLDWLLQGAYVFRRLTNDDRYPICSWLVAHAYGAAGRHFGVAPGAANPDDIWDYVSDHDDRAEEPRYAWVMRLRRIPAPGGAGRRLPFARGRAGAAPG